MWKVLSPNMHVLMYTRGKIPGGFADIAGITVRTQKLVYHTTSTFYSKHVFKKRSVVSSNSNMSATIQTIAKRFGLVHRIACVLYGRVKTLVLFLFFRHSKCLETAVHGLPVLGSRMCHTRCTP